MTDALSRVATDYDSFYEAEIAPKLRSLEVRRRTAVAAIYALSAVALLCLAIALSNERAGHWLNVDEDTVAVVSMLAMIGSAGAAMVIYGRMRDAVKTALVAPTCAFLGLDYSLGAKGFPLTRFDGAGILPDYSKSKLTDRIQGAHSGVDFELCEAALEKSVERTSGKGTRTEYEPVFNGLLLIYHFPKAFNGRILVVPERSWLGNKLGELKHGERVRLEDPRFEDRFAVFSDDQVEARYLLTPGFMEGLTHLAEHVGKGHSLSFAFQDKDLLIGLTSPVGQFEGGSLFKPLEDRGRATALLKELRLIYEIIDLLNLGNTSGA